MRFDETVAIQRKDAAVERHITGKLVAVKYETS